MNSQTSSLFGESVPRVDGAAKVTGTARYASDEPVMDPAFAFLVTSAVAKGRVTEIRLERAQAVSGVLDILTHENVGEIPQPLALDGSPATTTLEGDSIWYAGQIVAVVVAESFEAAREAAHKIDVTYIEEPASATFDAPGTVVEIRKSPFGPDPAKGDAEAALAAAAVRIEATYTTPAQHHNPIELMTATCVWDGPMLTVYESSRFMWGSKATVARQLGMDPANVRVLSRYVGGAFGSRLPSTRAVWVALAARRVGRPVKLVATRDQGFTIDAYRAETRQEVKIGARLDGLLTALWHEGTELTSRPSNFNVSGTDTTARLYGYANIHTAVRVAHADRNTPGFMRAPPETPYMFALESAIDELAYALEIDPIELRRVNDTQIDPASGRVFPSRHLMECFDVGAERFGWSKRDARPGSMRDGQWRVGYGCATACYPANVGPAAARLTVTADGKATMAMAGHEIGNGAYTTITVPVARFLGLRIEDVTVELGDSDLPPVIVAGGCTQAASTIAAALKACEEARHRVAEAAVAAPSGAHAGADPATLAFADGGLVSPAGAREPWGDALDRLGGSLEVSVEYVPDGLPPTVMTDVREGKPRLVRGDRRKDVTAYTFGAHFVEVRVHERTCEIRVPRVLSVFSVGQIVNPKTARSQMIGGVIWGLSSALHEETTVDPRTGRYVNDNLADYLLPVNADVPSIETITLPPHEDANPVPVNGIGELGIVGMNAAVANAVFHATGRRVRDLPIRIEHLL